MTQNILEDPSLITCKKPVQGSGVGKRNKISPPGGERKGDSMTSTLIFLLFPLLINLSDNLKQAIIANSKHLICYFRLQALILYT